MWTWRDAVLALLILALAVGWFSAHGPVELPEGRGMGPGTERAGESPLVVSGSGAEIVTVRAPEAPEPDAAAPAPAQSREELSGESASGATKEDMETMYDWTNLIWYAAGVAAVLTGMFAGPVVAALWRRVKNE